MSSEKEFTYKNSGTNRQANHYCARDYGPDVPNPNSYHYSNRNGSHDYSNSDTNTTTKTGSSESK
ncbi:hypothetical protein N7493_000760 [Penicillium malachiteum]|uniref:Uncharacterized protein n=1 Tax=Penicillium malachiteum TaxID=1324776 RepID=A0AAD6HWY3_9EURO|nr:hypothetical protein N7493_000760 [Penicillium malachiteum]